MGAVKAQLLDRAETLECAECQGEGFVESLVYGRGAGPEGLEPIYEQHACPECGGSGNAETYISPTPRRAYFGDEEPLPFDRAPGGA